MGQMRALFIQALFVQLFFEKKLHVLFARYI